ncbi:MAG TPA: ABC transporter transmembrane domain-containing protein [Stellaceae bacterium]|nr:ABC transporter transmembrane domain-containing protein [Stellaceae bacterium]
MLAGRAPAGNARTLFPRWLTQAAADALEPTIFRFILRYSLREQIYLVVTTLISFPFLYYSLDLPKLIINNAIGGKHFPHRLLGVQLGQLPYLAALCLIFLGLVLFNGWFKYHLNIRKGRVGERMLRRLRYELFQRVLRFPMPYFDRTATGQIISMLTFELEPVGGFIGDALALPIAQGGTLLTIFIFMFVQNPVLGGFAVALYPLQGYLIPKMQRRIRALGRRRIRKMRTLSDRIGEAIAAQVEIRTNAAAQYQLADIAKRLGTIYSLRFDIYNRKFFVKFLNNLLNQLTPFFFYLLGGYFVIMHELSFGALVAVLAAYKDLSSPWKELLDYYQNQQDVAIKYEQVVEQFQVPDLLDVELLLHEPKAIEEPTGDMIFANVSLIDSDGIRLLDGVGFALPLAAHAALVGASNSGKNLVPQLLARLYLPTTGRIQIGGIDLNGLSFAASGRLIGYVGPTSHLFAASLRDNLLLGLRYRPNSPAGGPSDAEHALAIEEARRSGNSQYDVDADWIDYAQAGAAGSEELERRMLEVLRLVDFDRDVYLFGLHGRLDPRRRPELAAGLLEARRRFAERLSAAALARHVERFDPQRYNDNASIAENLLFGTPIGPSFANGALAENDYLLSVLEKTGLYSGLLAIGGKLAATMIELFGSITMEPSLAEEFGFIRADELRDFERILARAGRGSVEALTPPDRARLLGLALQLAAARDRLGLFDDKIRQRIVEARRAFAQHLPDRLRGAVEFFDPERYNAAAQVEQNILFGTIVQGEADARERVENAIGEVLDELGLRDGVLSVGLEHAAGIGGSRLSPAQRQKVAIARAVLKRPRLLALNDATAVLDPAAENHILGALRQEFAARCIIAAVSRPEAAQGFDHVLLMEHGRLTRQGDFAAIMRGADAPTRLAAE